MQQNEKFDAGLSLAVQLTEQSAAQMEDLSYGYNEQTRRWQVIVKYIDDIQSVVKSYPDTGVTELLNQYAILSVREEDLEGIAALPEILFMEKPKRLFFVLDNGRSASCLSSVQRPAVPGNIQAGGQNLSGAGTLVAVIDSGIDYFHPAFRREDGSSRIAFLWDQSADQAQAEGRVPAGYGFGAQYTMDEINLALQADSRQESLALVPVTDRGSGHGTAVAAVAAGNGRGSAGSRYRGIAVDSELIVVKLGRRGDNFAGTTEVMAGLDYVLQKAEALQKPVAVNLSFGTNLGAHDGQSLFENYITQLNGVWKNVIVIASGNEGDARHHAGADLAEGQKEIEFAVGQRERSLSLQLWKQYADSFAITLVSPAGQRIAVVREEGQAVSYPLLGGRLLVYYGTPTPYTMDQEVFFEWDPGEGYIESGNWRLLLTPERIVDGAVDLWLPTVEEIGLSTGFLVSEPDTTLTIPSAAQKVITVGAYNTLNDSVASFSGRGNTLDGRVMPTLVAPGVGVVTAAPGGGYDSQTGTSIAAPFVTGSAALLMEWGIVNGNDPYLYGEKIKAYLISGARHLPGEPVPSVRQGWGALCVADSLPG
ncbi:MAG: S8 family serine peptidase [Clostridiaceae bacterium]|nr:S8 family serine peptidase [Clostridiaceae bacterium]